jgi:hypothetical protein
MTLAQDEDVGRWPQDPEYHPGRVRRCSVVAALVLAGAGCGGPVESGLFEWCSATASPDAGTPPAGLSYYTDVKPIVDRRCVRCHRDDGIAPFSLGSFELVDAQKPLIDRELRGRTMPPWLAAPCCSQYQDDWSLGEDERAKVLAWLAQGAPAGDPAAATATPPMGGLSRVDLSLKMPEPYRPEPSNGGTDDMRCFLLEWPLASETYVTGINVVPGNRALVHHVAVAVVSGDDDVASVRALDARDARQGFPCGGGFFSLHVTAVLGGAGTSEFPEGFGQRVPPKSIVVLNIHYSTARGVSPTRPTDQSTVELKLASSGRKFRSMAIANPAWAVEGAMHIEAGDPDAVFFYRYKPWPFTRKKAVSMLGVLPHMHAYASRFLMGILRADGSKDCLLEIPRWHFGWTQPFWLTQPKTLGPDDQLYLECHFDNSESNQPVISGQQRKPRDIAWGSDDQEMCAGFAYFVEP